MWICTDCHHPLEQHRRARNGAYRCRSTGCGCEIADATPPEDRDEAYERAAARARGNDFADTDGKDWT